MNRVAIVLPLGHGATFASFLASAGRVAKGQGDRIVTLIPALASQNGEVYSNVPKAAKVRLAQGEFDVLIVVPREGAPQRLTITDVMLTDPAQLRVAAYIRHAASLQAEAEDDQFDACSAFAASRGAALSSVYRDDGNKERDRLHDLLADAEAGLVDVIVTCSLDRFSRKIEGLRSLQTRMQNAGVLIWVASGGSSQHPCSRGGLIAEQ